MNKIEELKKLQNEMKMLSEENDKKETTAARSIEINERSKELEKELIRLNAESKEEMKQRFNNATNLKFEREEESEDYEIRKAFKNYCQTGAITPLNKRADETTFTGDVGVVIPSTVFNKIIDKLENNSGIYELVTKTNIKGGVPVPTSAFKVIASWNGEGQTPDDQKVVINTAFTFSYYKLQCRVALTLEAATVGLDYFENWIAEQVYKSLSREIERSIIAGTGLNQPTGVINETRIPTENIKTIVPANIDYKTWVTFIGLLDNAYLNGKNAIVLNQYVFYDKLIGLLDTNKQPVARVNAGVDGRASYKFLGFDIKFSSALGTGTETAAGTYTLAVFGDWENYVLNYNMQISYKRYNDETTDNRIDKATALLDGRVLDPNAFVLLKYTVAA